MTKAPSTTAGLLLALALCGCATASHRASPAAPFAEAVPLCQVLAHPEAHLGRRLLVRGYSTSNPHRRELWDDGCERGFLPIDMGAETGEGRQLRSRLDRLTGLAKGRPPRVAVVYSGMLTDHAPGFVCEGLCSRYSLEEAQLVALRRY